MSSANERPVCECHGEPMRWSADASCRAGGRWRCSERNREYYRKNAERLREQRRRYYTENIQQQREYARKYHKENAESRRKYRAEYWEKNAPELRSRKRQHYKKNAELLRDETRRRKGYGVPPGSPPVPLRESVRRAAWARGTQLLDDAIARYEEKLAEIHERSPHLKELTL